MKIYISLSVLVFCLFSCEIRQKQLEGNINLQEIRDSFIVKDAVVVDTSLVSAQDRMKKFFDKVNALTSGFFDRKYNYIEICFSPSIIYSALPSTDTTVINQCLEHQKPASKEFCAFITHVILFQDYGNGNFYTIVRDHSKQGSLVSIYYNSALKKFHITSDLGLLYWKPALDGPNKYSNILLFRVKSKEFYLYAAELHGFPITPVPENLKYLTVEFQMITNQGEAVYFDGIADVLLQMYAVRSGVTFQKLLINGKKCDEVLRNIIKGTKISLVPKSKAITINFPIHNDTVRYYLDEQKFQFIKMLDK
ncbi:hypothetical protein [Haliscomenobacter sp.]|uniref:hypothetical protein n=1 Tax=Haliscomenobacter sp. TaxID=2717303 RepID=UPI0035937A7F